ncbi:hypothetical protein K440DRAFT_631097, partial [Wilcoxina mikolae CBS 423.85]
MSLNIPFDTYVRSLAASFALSTNGQFIGRKQLPGLCESAIPDILLRDAGRFSKQQVLGRLGELLKAGLACELD